MNTLKPLVIFAALVGGCYVVYSRINHKSEISPEGANAWDGNLSIETGDSATSSGQSVPGLASIPGAGSAGGDLHAQRDAALGLNAQGQNLAAPPGAPNGDWHGAAPPASGSPGGVDYSVGAGAPPYDQQSLPGGPAGAPEGAPGYGSAPPANYGAAGGYNAAPNTPYGQQRDQAASPYGDSAAQRGGPGGSSAFAAAFEQAKHELDAGRLPEAHYQLSRWFDDPSLQPAEQQQVTELLDQLAGTVIYSTQSLLTPPCEVQPGETLERIAQRYNVPWQVLAKINGIDDPHSLRPGERLKVVRGPFNAVVSLDKRMLVLMLDNAYAGRFPIGLGRDHMPVEGQYFITEKLVDPVYHAAGRSFQRGDHDNPLGHRWLGLGNQIGIHGTNDPRNVGRTDLPGSISLSEQDVEDVYDILGEGSKVVIRR